MGMEIGVCKGCGQVKDIAVWSKLLCRPCYNRMYYAQDKIQNHPKKPKQAEAFAKSALVKIIQEVKKSHAWMLTDIKHRADEFDVEYSDELKHAIGTQELLDMI